MASFQKRGKTWQFTVSQVIDGKSKPIRKGGFRTKKEAQVVASQIEADLQKGITPQLKLEPIGDYFKGWLNIYKTDIDDITHKRYLNTYQTILTYFGNKPIQHIIKREYQEFLNHYGLSHARATTAKLNSHIRACVKEAIDEGMLRVDFTRNAVISGIDDQEKPEDKHLSYAESQVLLNELYKRLKRSLGYYLLLLGLTSGMRFGEMVGLTRQDFDFERNVIKIIEAWDYKSDKEFKELKNTSSEREILMDNETMNTFKQLFDSTPSNNSHDLVFFSAQSKRKVLTNEGMNKLLKSVLVYLDIKPITVHGLRHTHASVLLYRKISIYYVSERLGHKTIDTTLQHYAHVVKELRTEDANSTVKLYEEMRVQEYNV